MAILLKIKDYDKKVTKYRINRKTVTFDAAPQKCNNNNEPQSKSPDETVVFTINPLDLAELLQKLETSESLRRSLYLHAQPTRELNLQLVPVDRELIDRKWAQMALKTLWEAIEMDYLMGWLSTLGGGFSALGDEFEKCAETAGKISLRQFNLGLRLGDPFLQSRCRLYYSISLIQLGRLRAAKKLLRSEYKFAKANAENDPRLVKMCEGIWLKLLYSYWLKNRSSENEEMPQVCFKLCTE